VPEALKDGRYVIVGSLGEGSQGQTFDGVDRREGRPVAIKRFDVRAAKTWKDAELAEREARVLQSLSHPKLPRYMDYFEEDGALYLVMEKIEGESLAAMRKRGAVLDEADVVRLLRDASEVLDYLHRRAPPVIHRDLKPGNVLRRPDGSFAFVDFGAVREKLRPDGGSTVVGTFGFMAPEQFQGRALPASDVYAVGATALSMLTGRQPEDLPHKGLAIDVRAALSGRTPGLVDVLGAMLDPDPDRRAPRITPLLPKLEQGGPSRVDMPPRRESWRNPIGSTFAQRAEEYEEHAREYERRAAEGGPGAKGWLRGAEGWRKGARKWHALADRQREQFAREELRREGKRARRATRRAQRAERRRAHGHRPLAGPIALMFSVAFLLAMVAVWISTQVVVPALLRILAMFFAPRGLRAAADAVLEAGSSALGGMERSRRWFFAGATGSEGRSVAPREGSPDRAAGVRVTAEAPDPRVRVDAPTASVEGADEDQDPGATGTGARS
jgi:hypothetical protein